MMHLTLLMFAFSLATVQSPLPRSNPLEREGGLKAERLCRDDETFKSMAVVLLRTQTLWFEIEPEDAADLERRVNADLDSRRAEIVQLIPRGRVRGSSDGSFVVPCLPPKD